MLVLIFFPPNTPFNAWVQIFGLYIFRVLYLWILSPSSNQHTQSLAQSAHLALRLLSQRALRAWVCDWKTKYRIWHHKQLHLTIFADGMDNNVRWILLIQINRVSEPLTNQTASIQVKFWISQNGFNFKSNCLIWNCLFFFLNFSNANKHIQCIKNDNICNRRWYFNT